MNKDIIISQLETSHPDVYEKFMEGEFVVKSSRNTFKQISTDIALEHVNKVGKVAGGLIGITRSDSARDRWCLTYNDPSRMVDQTTAMFCMTLEDAEYAPSASGDTGPFKIKRNREAVEKLHDMLSRFPIFDSENDENDELTRLMTSGVATENINAALLTAEAHGTEKIREFVDTRLCMQKVGFHDTLKQWQSPSQKSQTIKTDIHLFQWLLVTKDSGRDDDLKNYFES